MVTQARPTANAGATIKKIRRYFRNDQPLFDRMQRDYDQYWALDGWIPDEEENILPEDAYTTNAPRVLAQKIIAFIAETEMIVRVPNDDAQKNQEERNKLTEALSIGMLSNVDRRMRRNGDPRIQRQMAYHSVVRGRYVAARAFLRKRPNGETYEDVLPIDPGQLVFQPGEEEPLWAAHRRELSRAELRDEIPNITFGESSRTIGEDDDDELEEIFDYYLRERNPNFNIQSQNPFERHPYVYLYGQLMDDKFIKPLTDLFTLSFPVVIAPVGSEPQLTQTTADRTVDKFSRMRAQFGESIFAENRMVWNKLNRVGSYLMTMTAKDSDPPTKVSSSDGTKELEEGATEKGAVVNIAVQDQQDVDFMETAQMKSNGAALLQLMERDSIAGGVPLQSFGILDKPLSSVALRQLGNNLEHRVLPRMEAVQLCIEGCLEVLVSQYETGAFLPITVSGKRFDRHSFSNKEINPEEISGHDALTVTLELALPEDETTRWTVAGMAMAPTVTGEPLASLEYVREHILNIQDPKLLRDQNMEVLTRQTSPVLLLLDQYRAMIDDGDQIGAAAILDQIRIGTLTQQVQGSLQIMQLNQMAQGLPPVTGMTLESLTAAFQGPDTGGEGQGAGGGRPASIRPNPQVNNPANGAVPATVFSGIGNQASPIAGQNFGPNGSNGGLVNQNGVPF